MRGYPRWITFHCHSYNKKRQTLEKPLRVCSQGLWRFFGGVTGWSVEGVALELFDEFAELGRETVHGALEACQEIERHDDREAYGRNRGQEILFHLASSCQVVWDGPGRGWRWRCRLGSGLGGWWRRCGARTDRPGVRRAPLPLPCARWLSGTPSAARL